jgi:hypothetical protein
MQEGPTDEVIRLYLDQAMGRRTGIQDKDVFISRVTIRNKEGECVRFKSGEKIWIDIEVRGRAECRDLALVLDIKDNSHYDVFNVSTQRMGHDTFSIEPGGRLNITFELDLHFASGSYHVGALIYQSNIQRIYDAWFPSATIFVSSDEDVRGVVNLYPKVEFERTRRP